MTGETPNPLDVLTTAVEDSQPGVDVPKSLYDQRRAALAQVEALAEAAQAFEREYQRQRGAVLGAGDFLLMAQAQDALRAALVPFGRTEGAPVPPPGAARENTND